MMTQKTASDSYTELRYRLVEMAAKLDGVISLERGDPDLTTPQHIIDAAKEYLRRGAALHMPVPEGLLELRQAIADKFSKENHFVMDPETEILVTTGGQEALFLLCLALINPGDEVLVPDLRYTSYDGAILRARGNVIPVPTTQADDYALRPEEVERRITPKTRLLLVLTPNNPTATLLSRENLEGLADVARRHNLMVISDEIYDRCIYDDLEHVSIASLPGMRERAVTLNAVSKAYAMTGWRVGYVAAPAPVVAAMRRLKIALNLTTSALSQWAAWAALTGPQDCIDAYRAVYDQRRQVLMSWLDEMGFSYSRPRGGFFVFPDISSSGMSDGDLCQLFLKEARVLTFPGTAYGKAGENHLRISFLTPKENLIVALDRMRSALAHRH